MNPYIQARDPRVILIGAPKSGTSSLFSWLNAHPEIVGSQPKEPFFFMDEQHPLCGRSGLSLAKDGLDAYHKFFPDRIGEKVTLEATTHTFYQESAIEHFAVQKEKPLAVVLLRHPSDRIRSSFLFTQNNLGAISRSLTFDMYVTCLLEGRMEEIRHFYSTETSYWIAARELQISAYVTWLKKWRDAIGGENLLVFDFNKLKSEPLGIVKSLCERLNVDPTFFNSFPFEGRNRTVKVRSQWLQRWAKKTAELIPASTAKSELKRLYEVLQYSKHSIGERHEIREAMSRLDAYFQHSNAELLNSFPLDDSNWARRHVA